MLLYKFHKIFNNWTRKKKKIELCKSRNIESNIAFLFLAKSADIWWKALRNQRLTKMFETITWG